MARDAMAAAAAEAVLVPLVRRCGGCDSREDGSVEAMLQWQKVSDMLIAASLLSIPLELFYFATRDALAPLRRALLQLGPFVVFCGVTHLLNVLAYDRPGSRRVLVALTAVKALCVVASAAAAVSLPVFFPRMLRVKAREDLLRAKARRLDRDLAAVRSRQETAWRVVRALHVRDSVDACAVRRTAVVQLAAALDLHNCAVWMPTGCDGALHLVHQLLPDADADQVFDGSTRAISVRDPDVAGVMASKDANVLPPGSVLAVASGGGQPPAGAAAAIRLPILRLAEQQGALLQARHELASATEARNAAHGAMSDAVRRATHPVVGLLSVMQQEAAAMRPEQRRAVDALARTSALMDADAMERLLLWTTAAAAADSAAARDHPPPPPSSPRQLVARRPFELRALIRNVAGVAGCLSGCRGIGFSHQTEATALPEWVVGDDRRVFHLLLHMVDALLSKCPRRHVAGRVFSFSVCGCNDIVGDDQDWIAVPARYNFSGGNHVFVKFQVALRRAPESDLAESLPASHRRPPRNPGPARSDVQLSVAMCKKIVQVMQNFFPAARWFAERCLAGFLFAVNRTNLRSGWSGHSIKGSSWTGIGLTGQADPVPPWVVDPDADPTMPPVPLAMGAPEYGRVPLCYLASGSQAATNASTDHLALLSFKNLITDDSSVLLNSWGNTSTVTYCKWHGVTCGAQGQRRGRVTALELPGLNLSGTISPKIANLTFLMRLDLSKNQLHGPAPHEFSLLLNLNHLDLSFNTLNGKIPPFPFPLLQSSQHQPWLQQPSSVFNNLQGEIPEELGILVDLESLSLLHNNLTGSIPANSFQNLQKLEHLSLAGNKLSGVIPYSIGNLTSLTYLLLNNNSFTGTIPPSLSELSSLTKLGLVGNNLSGVIPPSLGNLSNLLWLDIGYNYLTGTIPTSLGNLYSLTLLEIDENQLTGPIPPQLGDLSNLTYLGLEFNNLTGQIPDSLFNLTLLQLLSLQSNNLQGSLPEDMGNRFPQLEYLYLGQLDGLFRLELGVNQLEARDYNAIEGVIPEEIVNLVGLTQIAMGGNLLQGRIPVSLGRLNMLQDIEFEQNKLGGMIPTSLGNLTLLSQLRLAANLITGNIPSSLANCPLNWLDLQGNKLTGPVPKEILQMPSLSVFLDLQDNMLVHPRVSWKLTGIYLNLSFNDFEGAVPRQGFDSAGNDFKALIYDFIPNGNLDEWLHNPSRRDDYDLVAHVADFGLATFMYEDTDPSTSMGALKGTIGYIALEYGIGNEVSMSGDIFSYGILLLELFTAKRPTDGAFKEGFSLHQYVEMALPHKATDIIDQSLFLTNHSGAYKPDKNNRPEIDIAGITSALTVGIQCSKEEPTERM
ncbi:hypothetical protein EJB05_24828, partial [Eragrostis curvula]